MFSGFKKNRLLFDIFFTVVAAIASFFEWYDFFENGVKWKWLGGVVFGLMAVIKLSEVIEQYRRKRI
jgi:hypothetical protein